MPLVAFVESWQNSRIDGRKMRINCLKESIQSQKSQKLAQSIQNYLTKKVDVALFIGNILKSNWSFTKKKSTGQASCAVDVIVAYIATDVND